jgi:hypothetical protein
MVSTMMEGVVENVIAQRSAVYARTLAEQQRRFNEQSAVASDASAADALIQQQLAVEEHARQSRVHGLELDVQQQLAAEEHARDNHTYMDSS